MLRRGQDRRAAKNCCSSCRQHSSAMSTPAESIDAMIEAGERKHIGHAARGARPRIPGPEHQPSHARVHDGRGAHQARLEGHIKGRVVEPVAAQGAAALAQGENLRMRGGIVFGNRGIPVTGNNGTLVNEYRSDGYLAPLTGDAGARERGAHEADVACWLSPVRHAQRGRHPALAGTTPGRRRWHSAPRRNAGAGRSLYRWRPPCR